VPQFDFLRPTQIDEALEHLQDNDGFDVILWGGGTSTTLLLKQRLIDPSKIVDLKQLQELRGIAQTETGDVVIGAYTKLREIEKSPLLKEILPCLPATAALIGNVRVRNAATLGGHLVHADPAQDLPPLLLVLDAEIYLQGPNGERRVPIHEFFVDTMETVTEPDEIMTKVIIPQKALAAKSRYVKFAPRSNEDYGTVGVAASISFAGDGHTVEEVRIAVGGADATALRFPDAEAVLAGNPITKELCREAARIVFETVQPWDDIRGTAGYKQAMSKVWTERVLLSLREE
jgi:carbon-monoxide dehydrogenase medium subunit